MASVRMLSTHMHMFVNDTTIKLVADSQTQLHKYLSNDLKCVIKWVENNKLVLNVSKMKNKLKRLQKSN